jgi:nucleoredoxin
MKIIKALALWAVVGWTGSSVSWATPLSELLPETLKDVNGNEIPRSSLDGKLIGVYFSAEWCPPCRGFTPDLVKFRNKNAKEFEVVFVSSDKDAEAQKAYMKNYKMKWPAVAWGSDEAKKLKSTFQITGIPALIILDSEGNVITKNGRGDLGKSEARALDEWKKAAAKTP